MKIVFLIARYLLGLMFLIFGLNGFLHFIPMAPPPGDAGAFLGILFRSHYASFVFGVQLIAGILLLVNLYVPLALVLLGAVISNILIFHLTMAPAGLPPGILALILWLIVTYAHRFALRPIFVKKHPAAL